MKKKRRSILKTCIKTVIVAAAVLGVAAHIANKREAESHPEAGSPYTAGPVPDGQRPEADFYRDRGKRGLDLVLSFMGLVILAPVYALICIAVYLDDPGPVLFTQKRVGKEKNLFLLHKFRSMKMSTPHDMPTHMLQDPEQYITKVGKILRKSSLDELPQIWDIFRGKMSIIGPRPALWNQEDLVRERDRYGANDLMPGLTGWAQINGRDELEIPEKAKLDGVYAGKQFAGGKGAFLFDIKCLAGTVRSVLKSDGVVEGGTGELHKGKVTETNQNESGC